MAAAAVKVGVLALQGDVREHAAALASAGADAVEVRGPADLDGVDALVLPGGESTTMALLLDSSGLVEPLAARLAGGLPVFGTCAGMILLAAEVLDGRADQVGLGILDMAVRRNGFGRQVDSFETSLEVDGLDGRPIEAVFIRAPVVERVGAGVEVLASFAGRPVLCRQGPALVAAFHPELSGDDRLHRFFLDRVCERAVG
ncbi:MAG: pyridoxal 5'-phosphate synthase glutaminase subunit PdxT [Acidimicrobiales bacterium]